MDIKKNILFFQQAAAAHGARLIAVSKTQPAEKIREAFDAGQLTFGENKVQELTAKQPQLPASAEWHLIGHLQSNKVKYIAPVAALIHSIDSLRLLEEVSKQGKKINRVIPCLLQVHIAAEETKFGFDAEEIRTAAAAGTLANFSHAAVTGLMGMATLTDDGEKIRSEFRGLRMLFDSLRSSRAKGLTMTELSMGMSGDYQIALEEGSTLIRVGSAIFGNR